MSSINTNASAMQALQSLNMTNKKMDAVQNAISTGLSVGSAKDNAAYWSIATEMRSDNKALGTVKDALGLGAAKVDTATTGLTAAIDVADEIKTKLVAAREPGVDRDAINTEITALKEQLLTIAQSSSFSGENWLQNDGATAATDKSIVGSFNRSAAGNVSVSTIDITVSDITLVGADNESLGILTKDYDANQLLDTPLTGVGVENEFRLLDMGTGATTGEDGAVVGVSSSTSDADIDSMISVVDAIISDMTSAASGLGSVGKRVDMQSDFVDNLMNSIEKGIGQLVDADMNEESVKLQALQVQQQLGVQALSIANGQSQSILSLFR
ncbi:MAG: flagellin [Rhizobiales bacterium]|nr:flagellin [Hyphomicrobiales bacterium]